MSDGGERLDRDDSDESDIIDGSSLTPDNPPASGVSSPDNIITLSAIVQARDEYQRDEAGNLILGANGQPRKKPGRKPGSKSEVQQGANPSGQVADTAAAAAPKTPLEKKAQRVASAELARSILATSVGTLMTVIGPEWDFNDQAEADGMKAAVASYIEAKGGGSVSPETLLILVLAGYSLPRLAVPNTRSKIAGFFEWSKNAIRAIFSR